MNNERRSSATFEAMEGQPIECAAFTSAAGAMEGRSYITKEYIRAQIAKTAAKRNRSKPLEIELASRQREIEL